MKMDTKKAENEIIDAQMILAFTLHNPDNRLEELITRYGSIIRKVFQTNYVVFTPSTNQRIINVIGDFGSKTLERSKTTVYTYKKALNSH